MWGMGMGMGMGTGTEIDTATETEIKKRVDSFRQAVDQKSKATDRVPIPDCIFSSSTIHTLPGK